MIITITAIIRIWDIPLLIESGDEVHSGQIAGRPLSFHDNSVRGWPSVGGWLVDEPLLRA